MELEIGKRYVNGAGKVVGPLYVNGGPNYPFAGNLPGGGYATYTADGKWLKRGPADARDLVQEYVEDTKLCAPSCAYRVQHKGQIRHYTDTVEHALELAKEVVEVGSDVEVLKCVCRVSAVPQQPKVEVEWLEVEAESVQKEEQAPRKLPPPMPKELPNLQPGWVYAGKGPIREISRRNSPDICGLDYFSDAWSYASHYGDRPRYHYGVRVGSDIQKQLFPDYAETKRDEPSPPPGWLLFGSGPVNNPSMSEHQDIAMMTKNQSEWDVSRGYVGRSRCCIYAIRSGSELARLNGLEPAEKLPPPMPKGLPPLNPGWVYAGPGPLPLKDAVTGWDLAGIRDDDFAWDYAPHSGKYPRYQYAVKVGSTTQKELFPDYEP